MSFRHAAPMELRQKPVRRSGQRRALIVRPDIAQLIDDRLEIGRGLRLVLLYALAQSQAPGHFELGRNVAAFGGRRESLKLETGEAAGKVGILHRNRVPGVRIGARGPALGRDVDRSQSQRHCREKQGNCRDF